MILKVDNKKVMNMLEGKVMLCFMTNVIGCIYDLFMNLCIFN